MCKRIKLCRIFSILHRDNSKKHMPEKHPAITKKVVASAETTAEIIRGLNERYNKLEQAERNYAWVNAWRNSYSRTLGFSDSFEKINEYIVKRSQTIDPIYQTELDEAIWHSCVRLVDETLKRLLEEKATPKHFDFVDICAGYQSSDGDLPKESIARLKEYLKGQECSFGAYADGTVVISQALAFIKDLEAFWKKAKRVLEDKHYEEYRLLYANFLNSESFFNFIGNRS